MGNTYRIEGAPEPKLRGHRPFHHALKTSRVVVPIAHQGVVRHHGVRRVDRLCLAQRKVSVPCIVPCGQQSPALEAKQLPYAQTVGSSGIWETQGALRFRKNSPTRTACPGPASGSGTPPPGRGRFSPRLLFHAPKVRGSSLIPTSHPDPLRPTPTPNPAPPWTAARSLCFAGCF